MLERTIKFALPRHLGKPYSRSRPITRAGVEEAGRAVSLPTQTPVFLTPQLSVAMANLSVTNPHSTFTTSLRRKRSGNAISRRLSHRQMTLGKPDQAPNLLERIQRLTVTETKSVKCVRSDLPPISDLFRHADRRPSNILPPIYLEDLPTTFGTPFETGHVNRLSRSGMVDGGSSLIPGLAALQIGVGPNDPPRSKSFMEQNYPGFCDYLKSDSIY